MQERIWLNDVHSKLNSTAVRELICPQSLRELRKAIAVASEFDWKISCSGGRHAMGGQQFGSGNLHLDLNSLNQVLAFDPVRGLIEVEAGMQWPQLIDWLLAAQPESLKPWSICQKQTGADRFSIAGALSANIHGRGLKMGPFVNDIESFTMVTPDAEVVNCSRSDNC